MLAYRIYLKGKSARAATMSLSFYDQRLLEFDTFLFFDLRIANVSVARRVAVITAGPFVIFHSALVLSRYTHADVRAGSDSTDHTPGDRENSPRGRDHLLLAARGQGFQLLMYLSATTFVSTLTYLLLFRDVG